MWRDHGLENVGIIPRCKIGTNLRIMLQRKELLVENENGKYTKQYDQRL
jgi:hypothetical protein